MINYKVEELSPGTYMVWDRGNKKSLLRTDSLKEACVYCCGLRAMEGSGDNYMIDPLLMEDYCKNRFGNSPL